MKTTIYTDTSEMAQQRKECLALLEEVGKWGIRPFSKDRRNLISTIKFSYNRKRLNYVHTRLTAMRDNAMMNKLKEGLE